MILGFDQLKITMFWAHYPSFTSIQLAKTKDEDKISKQDSRFSLGDNLKKIIERSDDKS